MKVIHFYSKGIPFIIKHKTKLRSWIHNTISDNQKKPLLINYIFTTDKYLGEINKDFLKHDTYTDIITFDQSSDPYQIEADIFISVERIKENAKNFNVTFTNELHRVMIHGILHLLGYKDKNESQRAEMRKIENHYLALRF